MAGRRMRELLTTKFPPGTFPVKIAIPVVPTVRVRVVITFTKFVELQPIEEFYTPFSSPRQFVNGRGSEEATERDSTSGSSWAWLPRSSKSCSTSKQQGRQQQQQEKVNPFAIPSGYAWSNFDDKSRKKKSKSTRITK